MPGALEALDDILRRVDSGQLAVADAIGAVLTTQIQLRNQRRLQTAMRQCALARGQDARTTSTSPFSRRSSASSSRICTRWLPRAPGERRCSSGPPGVGKTHLAISLAVAAAESGRRVYYATLADLITSLEEAQQAGHLTRRLRTLVFPSLMVIDEIGYLPITRTGAQLFFQLMSRRYERALDGPHQQQGL